MLKKLFQSFRSPLRRAAHKRSTPEVLNSNQHPLRRGEISRYALSVVDRLQQAGYQAYLVGGCVRDLLLNLEPKDFDEQEQVRPLIRACGNVISKRLPRSTALPRMLVTGDIVSKNRICASATSNLTSTASSRRMPLARSDGRISSFAVALLTRPAVKARAR